MCPFHYITLFSVHQIWEDGNLKKEVYRCPKCGERGGIFDLYSLFSGVPRDKVLDNLINRTEPHEKTEHKPKYIGSVDIPDLESPLADVETRHLVYSSLLSKLTLASDHKENLLNRGLNEDAIARLGYKSTPAIGMTAIAKKIADEGLNPSGVPGFYRLDNNDWTFVNEQRGILIPVCDEHRKIQAIQIRRDNVQKTFADLSSLLGEIGIPFGTYLWNPEYKGLDDYMHAFLMRYQ